MKVDFRMPVKLPKEDCWVRYSVETSWRLDIDRKIGDFLTLEVDLAVKGMSARKARSIYQTILDANPEIIEASIEEKLESGPVKFCLIFKKHGEFAEQDAEDRSIIHWPPNDRIEWLPGEN